MTRVRSSSSGVTSCDNAWNVTAMTAAPRTMNGRLRPWRLRALSGDPAADLAAPMGQFDVADVVGFLQVFGAGCP